jgi:hypothetical protein
MDISKPLISPSEKPTTRKYILHVSTSTVKVACSVADALSFYKAHSTQMGGRTLFPALRDSQVRTI